MVQEIQDCPSDHEGDYSPSDYNDDDDDERVLDTGSGCLRTQKIMAISQSPSTTQCLFPYYQPDSESVLSSASSVRAYGDEKKVLHMVQVDAKDSVHTVINCNVYPVDDP